MKDITMGLEPMEDEDDDYNDVDAHPMYAEDDDEPAQDLPTMLDNRLSELPDEQKAFLIDNLTEPTVLILGLVLGAEAVPYFAQYLSQGQQAQPTQAASPTPELPQQQSVPPSPVNQGLMAQL